MSDYNLTKDEVESLKTISMGGGRKFALDELFEIKTSPWLNIWSITVKRENVWGLYYEFIWRTQENYWIQGYIELQEKIKPNEWWVISVSQVGSVHAQLRNKSWYGSQNIFILKPLNEKLLNQYLITAINKKLNKYNISYTTFPTLKTLKEEEISLPVNSNNQIDYPLIETYIKATQKLVIKDLVDKVNEKLKTYKNII